MGALGVTSFIRYTTLLAVILILILMIELFLEMLRVSLFIVGVMVVATKGSPPPCQQYGCNTHHHHHQLYLPAPPGKTPPCAKYGQTYCEHIDNYPT
jgi:hypothetical protein